MVASYLYDLVVALQLVPKEVLVIGSLLESQKRGVSIRERSPRDVVVYPMASPNSQQYVENFFGEDAIHAEEMWFVTRSDKIKEAQDWGQNLQAALQHYKHPDFSCTILKPATYLGRNSGAQHEFEVIFKVIYSLGGLA